MNLFITGATGFVGSTVTDRALTCGHAVVALRRSADSLPRIPLIRQPNWLTATLDDLVPEHFAAVDAVIHLAAHSPNVPYDSLPACLRWNLTASLNALEAARRAGVSRFVVAGSCFEYGRAAEPYDFIPPNCPLDPTNPYAASKAAAFIALRQWATEHQLHFSYHRLFQVFGRGEHPSRFWPSLREAARRGEDFPMTSGEQIRDFTPVEFASDALLSALHRNVQPGEPLVENVGTGQPQTLLGFATHWWNLWGATGQLQPGAIPYRPREIMRYVPIV